MEIALDIVYNVGILFIMMIPGVILKRCRLCPDGFGKGISNLVLYIAQPCLIFKAYLIDYSAEILKRALMTLLLSVVAHLVFLLALLFFNKANEDRRRMLRFATIFSNAAFMGIPLIEAVLGAEFTIYASIYNITFNMFLWTLGVHICTDRNVLNDGTVMTSQASVKRALLHPVTLAAALGLIFFLLPINGYVPELVRESVSMVSALVAPLSMLVLGLRIAEIDFRGFFTDINLYVFLVLRHLALPALVFGALSLMKLVGLPIDAELFKIIMIMASAPAASSATMFAEKYDCDAAYVSKLVAFSTIISIATMPIMAMPVDLLY
ncbi:MAG: AEC family transporter [Clostridia bacterium]|nr:AEC family transporter [Clostridia bacterium]